MCSIGIWFVRVYTTLDATKEQVTANSEDEIGNIKLVEIRNFRLFNMVVVIP